MVIMVTTNYTYSYSRIFRLLLFPVASVLISQTVQCFTATYKFTMKFNNLMILKGE